VWKAAVERMEDFRDLNRGEEDSFGGGDLNPVNKIASEKRSMGIDFRMLDIRVGWERGWERRAGSRDL
tara:strand:+ start:372 stop:575 length:204 start_codon:yes stop_codon:yes gene_type:complete